MNRYTCFTHCLSPESSDLFVCWTQWQVSWLPRCWRLPILILQDSGVLRLPARKCGLQLRGQLRNVTWMSTVFPFNLLMLRTAEEPCIRHKHKTVINEKQLRLYPNTLILQPWGIFLFLSWCRVRSPLVNKRKTGQQSLALHYRRISATLRVSGYRSGKLKTGRSHLSVSGCYLRL